MSDQAQPPTGSGDFFVLGTNDLSVSRSQPVQGSLLERFVKTPSFIISGFFLYVLFVIIFWAAIRGVIPQGAPTLVLAVWFGVIATLPLAIMTVVNTVVRGNRTKIPVYRDLVTIQEVIQLAFVFLVISTIALLIFNLRVNLADSGLSINFNVLSRDFGTEVSEGPDPRADLQFLLNVPVLGEQLYSVPIFAPDTYFRALAVGFVNTLRVVWLSLISSTTLGVLLGIGLLSNNWLVKNVAFGWVEVFRNTPLLVQLFFMYTGVIRLLPSRPDDALTLFDVAYFSSRGFYFPAVVNTPTSGYFYWALAIGFVLGVIAWRWRQRVNEQTGQPANGLNYFLSITVGLGLVGFVLALVLGGTPILFDIPEASRFNFSGGTALSGEYMGLFLGLTTYTSAYIADIVRAGIQSVPKGQIEASRALGLRNMQTLNMIILPQALRLAVPPLTNQYVNLAKNSSLGLAIGFTDLFSVANISINQSGQSVVIFVVILLVYLAVSLLISLVMNIFNSTLRLKTR